MAFAAATSALIAILVLPAITRAYSPEVYGAFAFVLATATVISTGISGRFELAVILASHDPDGDREAWKMARLSVRVGTVSAIVLQLLSLIVLLPTWDIPSSTRYAILAIPLMSWVAGLATIQTLVQTRMANYQLMSVFAITRVVGMFGCQLLLGQWSPTVASLIIGSIVGYLPAALHLFYLLSRLPRDCERSYRELAGKYDQLPKYQVFAAIARSLETNALLFAITVALGGAMAGLFALTLRVVLAPPTVLSTPVGSIYFREAARVAGDRARSLKLHTLLSVALLATGLGVSAALYVGTYPLIGLLGPEWSEAGPVLRAVIPLGLAAFVGTVPSSVLAVFRRNRNLLIWRTALATLPPLVILLSPDLGVGDVQSILAAALLYLTIMAAFALYARRVVRTGELSDGSGLAADSTPSP